MALKRVYCRREPCKKKKKKKKHTFIMVIKDDTILDTMSMALSNQDHNKGSSLIYARQLEVQEWILITFINFF
jgi:hypothetical protein